MPQTLTKTVTAYKFNELSESAKQRALEKMYDINVDNDFWSECAIDDFKEVGKIIGIDIEKIYFSGFSCQGDGACFEGRYEYKKGSLKAIKDYAPKDTALHAIVENLAKIQAKYFYKLGAKVKHSGHYYHAYCTEIDIMERDQDGYFQGYSDLPVETIDEMIEILRDFMNWIYKRLNDEYNFLTSEEEIIGTIEANEYDFTEEGNFPAI
jgi:hypothetical protein